jgi:excinuclease ABC subunit B
LEAKRLEERTNFDLEMIRELGYCSGIENYSRYLDGRLRNKTVLFVRLFSKDFLLVVDESHVTLSQVSAMYGGDRSRKFGRIWLPTSCSDGQSTVKIDEFEAMQNQVIYVSATPADYELQKTGVLS